MERRGSKVLLVHGWSGRASNMFCIIERLIEKTMMYIRLMLQLMEILHQKQQIFQNS